MLSLGFVLIMVAEGAICPYCLATHVCNFGIWITIEIGQQRVSKSNAVTGGVIAFFVTTIVLGGWQMSRNTNKAIAAEQLEQDTINQIVAQTNPITQAEKIPNSPTPVEIKTPTEPKQDLLASRWTWGDPNAPVQVVMISDYQCPDCRTYETDIQAVLSERSDVALSVKHFPMCTDCNPNLTRNMHANACWAARGAETAGILGGDSAFWEWHRWLFDNHGKFPGGQLPVALVEELGFDRRAFTEIMTSDETLDLVTSDIEDGVELGLFYTPMIFINGVELKWHLLPASLRRTVNRVADAIASGREESEIVVPPVGIEKYIADWRDGRIRTVKPSARVFRRSPVDEQTPSVTAFIDFISPNTKTFLDELRAWEKVNGVVDLELRVNPISHDCNPNLPDRLKSRPGACVAARALKAAGVIGGGNGAIDMAFWLIDNGPDLRESDQQPIINAAASFGLNRQQFAEALNSAGVENLVDQDIAEFKRQGFKRVPTVLISGRVIPRIALQGHSVIARILDGVNTK
ncbi:MAG: thioredoxin domain-containing protein [Phycisphaerae bacterium]|nr:thioredoxin domain-containing protein [Phycisphaerae bacterium]